jgi:hypothetical protein
VKTVLRRMRGQVELHPQASLAHGMCNRLRTTAAPSSLLRVLDNNHSCRISRLFVW